MKSKIANITAGMCAGALAACVLSASLRLHRGENWFVIVYFIIAGIALVGLMKRKTWAGFITLLFPCFSVYITASAISRDYQLWAGTSWAGRIHAVDHILFGQLPSMLILVLACISYLVLNLKYSSKNEKGA